MGWEGCGDGTVGRNRGMLVWDWKVVRMELAVEIGRCWFGIGMVGWGHKDVGLGWKDVG